MFVDKLHRKVWNKQEEDILKGLFSYDSEGGKLLWKVNSGSARIGYEAGSKDKDGYLRVQLSLGKKRMHARVHRICWFLFYGSWPSRIDHVNGDRMDNRIINLREANGSENMINKPTPINNTSGRKGVSFSEIRGKFVAYINYGGKRRHLGDFASFESACHAREQAEKIFHGEFTRNENN